MKGGKPSKLYVHADRISCYKNNDTAQPQGAISYTIFMWTNKKEDGTFDKDTKGLDITKEEIIYGIYGLKKKICKGYMSYNSKLYR